MQRQFENPLVLEARFSKAQEALAEAVRNGRDDGTISSLHRNVAELAERVNTAWQDDEFDKK